MKGFIDKALNAAKSYSVWDYGWLKVTLISFGILVGAYFAQFFIQFIAIVWAVFILTYIWIVYKTFFKYWGKK
jgi:small multidrug resistance family-3 protein